MFEDDTGPESQTGPSGAVLQDIDPDLNIFALANGLDLFRNPDGQAARVLEWYNEAMERRIVLTPSASGAAGGVDLAVEAEARVEGSRRALARPFQEGAAPGQLREILPRAIEACNALTRVEVEREGRTR